MSAHQATRERWVPGQAPGMVEASHRARYELALDYLRADDTALDAGCGSGWGVEILATRARRVIGVDISAEAISYAAAHFSVPNAEFLQADCCSIPIDSGSIDVATTFEVIEHLQRPVQFVAELARVLRPGGYLLLSTPVSDGRPSPANPFHVHEFSPDELRELLSSHFPEIQLLGQRLRARRFVRRLRRERLGIRKVVPKRVQTAVLRAMREVASDDLTAQDTEAFEFTNAVADCEIMVAVARMPRPA